MKMFYIFLHIFTEFITLQLLFVHYLGVFTFYMSSFMFTDKNT